MQPRNLVLMAPVAFLVACGSDESPTATPTPTSTQTGSSISYTAFEELQGAQTFQSACAVLDVTDNPDAPAAEGVFAFAESAGLEFDLSDDQQVWTITGDTLDLVFGPGDLRESGDDDIIFYQRQIASGFIQIFALTDPDLDDGVGDDDADFVRLAGLQVERFDDRVKNYTCVIGVPIDAADTLPADNFSFDDLESFGALYRTEAGGLVVEYRLDNTEADVEIDRAQGRLRVRLDLEGEFSSNNSGTGDGDEFGTFTADIPLNGNPRDFTGPLLDTNQIEVGEFAGVFFGPKGTELGIVFSANSTDEDGQPISFVGAVIEDRDDD